MWRNDSDEKLYIAIHRHKCLAISSADEEGGKKSEDLVNNTDCLIKYPG